MAQCIIYWNLGCERNNEDNKIVDDIFTQKLNDFRRAGVDYFRNYIAHFKDKSSGEDSKTVVKKPGDLDKMLDATIFLLTFLLEHKYDSETI